MLYVNPISTLCTSYLNYDFAIEYEVYIILSARHRMSTVDMVLRWNTNRNYTVANLYNNNVIKVMFRIVYSVCLILVVSSRAAKPNIAKKRRRHAEERRRRKF